jgi:hypothetical protein
MMEQQQQQQQQPETNEFHQEVYQSSGTEHQEPLTSPQKPDPSQRHSIGFQFQEPTKSNMILVVLGASFIELIAGGKACDDRIDENDNHCDDEVAFSVVLGVFGFLVSLIQAILTRASPGLAETIAPFVSWFLVLWWGIGACVVTFNDPFSATSNGYFSSWLAFAFSTWYFCKVVPHAREFLNKIGTMASEAGPIRQLIFALLAASVVEMIAASSELDDNDENDKSQKVFGVVLGVLSAVFSAIMLFAPLPKPVFDIFLALLALLWFPGIGVLTFDAPFVNTGNGYFSCWTAFLAAWWALFLELSKYSIFGGVPTS